MVLLELYFSDEPKHYFHVFWIWHWRKKLLHYSKQALMIALWSVQRQRNQRKSFLIEAKVQGKTSSKSIFLQFWHIPGKSKLLLDTTEFKVGAVVTHVDFQCCPLLDFWRTKVWISGTVGAFDSGKSKLAGYVSSFALELGGWPYASRGYTKDFFSGRNYQAVSIVWYTVGEVEEWLYPVCNST